MAERAKRTPEPGPRTQRGGDGVGAAPCAWREVGLGGWKPLSSPGAPWSASRGPGRSDHGSPSSPLRTQLKHPGCQGACQRDAPSRALGHAAHSHGPTVGSGLCALPADLPPGATGHPEEASPSRQHPRPGALRARESSGQGVRTPGSARLCQNSPSRLQEKVRTPWRPVWTALT